MSDENKTTLKGGLDLDFINKLMVSGNKRNQYGPKVVDFDNSDEGGVNVVSAWPEFAEKSPETLYQGFMNAVKKAKLEEVIFVRKHDGNVFLLHQGRVTLKAKPATDTDTDDEATEADIASTSGNGASAPAADAE